MKNLRKDNRILFSDPKTKLCLLAAFVFPIVILLAVAYKFQLYPFSEKCFATKYMQETYFPIISELRRKVSARESLFYTWNAGGGANFWALLANYAASPFTLIYVLFPKVGMQKLAQIIMALKVASASVAFSVFLWKKENVVSPIGVAMSVAYALSGYVMTFSQEPALLDTVILAPILILTLSNLVRGVRGWVFSVVLALTMSTSLSGGLIMLLATVIFFPLLLMEAKGTPGFERRFWAVFTEFARNWAFGIGLSSLIWGPLFLVLSESELSTHVLKIPADLGMQLKVWDVLEQLCFDAPVVFPSDMTQSPSVYCGIVAVLLVLLYGFSSKIRFQEKVYAYCALLFFHLTMASKVLAFVMHGLHFPVAGVYPQALPVVLMIMYMGARLLSTGELFEERLHLQTAVILMALFLVIRCAIETKVNYADYAIMVGLGLIVFYYALCCRIQQKEKKGTAFWVTILSAIMIIETGLSVYRPLKEQYYTLAMADFVKNEMLLTKQLGDASKRTPNDKKEKMQYELDSDLIYRAQDELKAQLFADTASTLVPGSRVIIDESWSQNDGLVFGVPCMGTTYTLPSASYIRFVEMMGLRQGGEEGLAVTGYTPVSALIWNIGGKYSYEYGEPSLVPVTSGGSLGYYTEESMIYAALAKDASWVEAQNYIAKELTGVEPFVEVSHYVVESENVTKKKDGSYSINASDVSAQVLFELDASPKLPIYILCDASQSALVEVRECDDKGFERATKRYPNSTGVFLIAETHSSMVTHFQVRVTFTNPEKGEFRFAAATLDGEKLDLFRSEIQARGLSITGVSAGQVDGTIHCPSSGNVIFSIPYDSGWTAYVDGVKTHAFAANKALLAIHIPAGDHTIQLKYRPSGFTVFAIISLVSLFLILLSAIVPHLPKKKKIEEAVVEEILSQNHDNEVDA